jgi:hypothetical protein
LFVRQHAGAAGAWCCCLHYFPGLDHSKEIILSQGCVSRPGYQGAVDLCTHTTETGAGERIEEIAPHGLRWDRGWTYWSPADRCMVVGMSHIRDSGRDPLSHNRDSGPMEHPHWLGARYTRCPTPGMEHYHSMIAALGGVHMGAVARAMWERLPQAERPAAYAGAQFVVAEIDTLCGAFGSCFMGEYEERVAARFIEEHPSRAAEVVSALQTEDPKYPFVSSRLVSLQYAVCLC